MVNNIQNTAYWQKITADGKITQAEIREFDPKNTGLPERDCNRARSYLWEVLSCSKRPDIDIKQIDADKMEEGDLVSRILEKIQMQESRQESRHVSKGGSSDYDPIIRDSRAKVIAFLDLKEETIPQTAYMEIRNSMILGWKSHRIGITGNAQDLSLFIWHLIAGST